MSMQNFKRLVLAKIEGTYNTDPVPNASNAIKLNRDLAITPLESDVIELDYLVGYMGANRRLVAGQRVGLAYSVDLAASGDAGTAPPWGVLARACGMSELITADTDVVYKPASSQFESVTHYFYHDGELHKSTGGRGNMVIKAAVKQRGQISFKFMGQYLNPIADANPVPDVSAWQLPRPITRDFVTTMTLHGAAAKVYDFEIDIGQSVNWDETMSSGEVVIGARDAKGSITIQKPAIGSKNWYQSIVDAVAGAFAFQIETTAGKIIKIDAPAVQLLNPQEGDNNGVATMKFDMVIPPVSGNDEISITVK